MTANKIHIAGQARWFATCIPKRRDSCSRLVTPFLTPKGNYKTD